MIEPSEFLPSEFHRLHEAFRKELQELLNRHSMENGSDTPDFLLADYLIACLAAFNAGVNMRDTHHGFRPLHFRVIGVKDDGTVGEIGRG